MYRILLAVLLLGLSVTSCQQSSSPSETDASFADKDVFYHYSIWTALVNKVYDGKLTVAEVKKHGDIGLGTYDGVDGELIMLDNVLYHVPASGVVSIANDSMHIPYLNTTFFEPDSLYQIKERINYDELRKQIQQSFPSKNFFYAFKIHGEFDTLRLGSLYKQERPYAEGLDSLMPKRPIFNHTNIKGTMVGFFCPDFIGDINVAGFHLHFISDDKKVGGHVMEFSGQNFEVGMDKISSYNFILPEGTDFDTVDLNKKFQYGKK